MFFKSNIEICEMSSEDLAGRVKVKVTALKVSNDDSDNNENGLNWDEGYIQNNIKSFIGASYKVSFVDKNKEIPSGHGTMDFDSEGNVIFEDSDTVGSIQNAYIDTLELEGKQVKAVVTEGYLYQQSYPNFVAWLRDEKNMGTIYGSVEINGKGKSKKIIYANEDKNIDGSPRVGRRPKVFDFVSVAILSSFVQPSDIFSQVVEVNAKQKEVKKLENKIKKQDSELNELSYEDFSALIASAYCEATPNAEFDDNDCRPCWTYNMYPFSRRAVISDGRTNPSKFYQVNYEIDKSKVTVSNIVEVEHDWKPVDEEEEVHFDSAKNIKHNEEEDFLMEKNAISELNTKLEERIVEINALTTKNTELNEAIVNANKLLGEANTKLTAQDTELNELKEAKVKFEEEKAKVEVNEYFDTEIPKNGFAEEEINSLKQFVKKLDLIGLKTAESELCAKKFKEIIAKEQKTDVESNSKSSFLTFQEKEKKIVSDKIPTFFN